MHCARSALLVIATAALLAGSGCKREPTGPLEGAGRGATSDAGGHPSATPPATDPAAQPDPQTNSPAARTVADELEPNDSRAEAMALVPGQSVRGALSGARDADHFVLALPPGEWLLTAELRPSAAGDPRLALLDSSQSGVLRLVDNEQDGGSEQIAGFVVSGTALLRVDRARRAAKGPDFEYTLDIATAPVPEDDEREPNGNSAKARPLAPGSAVRGTLNTPDDRDTFRIDPGDGRPLSVRAVGAAGAKAELLIERGGAALRVELQGDTPTVVPGVAASDAKAKVFISVEARGKAAPSEPYRLEVAAMDAEPGQDPEPNDGREGAVPLELDSDGAGRLGHRGDRDWFLVTGAPAGVLHLEATSDDARITLLVEPPTPGAVVAQASAAAVGEAAAIANLPCDGERPVYLHIRAEDDPALPVRYRLRASWRDAGGEEREPNDAQGAEGITPVTLGASVRAYVGWPGDVDRFPLDLSEQPSGRILTLRIHAPADVPLTLRVVDATEAEVATLAVAPGDERTLTHFFRPGVYALEVRAQDPSKSSDAPYQLTVPP
jgi:hypothetical protein